MRKLVVLILLIILVPFRIFAQEVVTITGKVTVYNKETKKEINEKVLYSRMLRKEEARECHAAFERLTGGKKADDMNLDIDLEPKIKLLKKKYGFIAKNQTNIRGRFETEIPTTYCLLFLTVDDSQISEIVEIVPGKTEYNVKIEVQRLMGIEAVAAQKDRAKIGGGTGDPDDGNEYFRIKMHLLKGDSRDNARMIIQTYAVDCQTDDTLAYCAPVVYEGAKYHELQDKRMGFDYFNNDSLRSGYQASKVLSDDDEYIDIDTTLVYKKTDKKASFRGPFRYVIEDYHRVYASGSYSGTCLRERPFKFLDFTPALANLELLEEFKMEAQSKVSKENRDLALSFEVGKAVLKDDSMNTVNMNKLIEELQSYGKDLLSPAIQGMASPDGNMKKNQELAQQRAQLAASKIQRYLPAGMRVASSSSVYTWLDVVERLQRKGKIEEANQVREIVTKTDTPDRELRLLEFYDTEIVPILDGMRVMRATYKVIRDKVLTPQEAVIEFRQNMPQYQSGEKKFSDGDYYNIFANLTDSAEIDTLAMIAYRHITKNPDYAIDYKIAPYVCNLVALINLRKGTPNPSILEPFVDLSRKNINAIKPIDNVSTMVVNRRETLLNQAVAYYQQTKMDSCKYFVKWLKNYDKNDPALTSLERIMDLKSLHYNNFRTPDEENDYESAKNYVLNISDENKAILYSEIPDWGNTKGGMEYVDLMPDESAKKWYLKGILWAQLATREVEGKHEKQRARRMELMCERKIRDELELSNEEEDNSGKPDLGGGFFLLTEDEETDLMMTDPRRYAQYNQQKQKYMDEHDGQLPVVEVKVKPKNPDDDIEIEGIPFYLAYFHHCFELEPKFKRYYASEGHVSEDMRKLYQYKKSDIPAYKKLFRLLNEYQKRKEEEELKKLDTPTEKDKNMNDTNEQKNTTPVVSAL